MPNCRPLGRHCRRACARAPASARTTNTPAHGNAAMKVSFFETGRYVTPPDLPREWPVPSGAYDPEIGARACRAMVERVRLVEELGFDWVSVSEHHYSPRILTPSPLVSAAFLAAQTSKIKISLL